MDSLIPTNTVTSSRYKFRGAERNGATHQNKYQHSFFLLHPLLYLEKAYSYKSWLI